MDPLPRLADVLADADPDLAATLAAAAPGDAPRAVILDARAPDGPFPDALPPTAFLAEQGRRDRHDALLAAGVATDARLPEGVGPFDLSAAILSGVRAADRAAAARAWSLARPGGLVLVAGAKTEGIEALQRELTPHWPDLSATPKRHGRVLAARRADAPAPAEFAEWAAAARPSPAAPLADGRRFVTAPGVFSADGPDPGSMALMADLPRLRGAVADLGAGWGLLSDAILASPEVTRLDLVEADLTALDCARANLSDPRCVFHWADARAATLPADGHDHVVANPPFHDGRGTDPDLGRAFLAAAARLLKPSGTLHLVANRALPYERDLDALFTEIEARPSPPGYKLVRAFRPLRRPGAGAAGGRGRPAPRRRG